MLPVRLVAVYVVDLPVEGVGREDGPVQGAAGHGVRAQQDVARVPDDEGEGGEEPEEGEGGRGVGPVAEAGGGGAGGEGAGGGFGGGEVGGREGGGVGAGGYHGDGGGWRWGLDNGNGRNVCVTDGMRSARVCASLDRATCMH